MKNQESITIHFKGKREYFSKRVPAIVSEEAITYAKDRFSMNQKNYDGKAWPAWSKRYKPKGGSLLVGKTAALVNSIQEKEATAERVIVTAGNSKVPYAQIHNQGGTITRAARSETFSRNRYSRGKKKGSFKRGTTAGKGFTFKQTTITMPKRQFLGFGRELKTQMTNRLVNDFNAAL